MQMEFMYLISVMTVIMMYCIYLAMGRLFLVKSMRRTAKGMEHTASTFTTLKAENLTWKDANNLFTHILFKPPTIK